MNDPWKYVAFPAAAVGGYILASLPSIVSTVESLTGLTPYISEIIVVAASGFVAGFMVDEVIPAYLEKVQERRGGGGMGGDLGGDIGGGDDFDFDE